MSGRNIQLRVLDLNPTISGLQEQLEAERGKYCVVYDVDYSAPCSGFISDVTDEHLVINRREHVVSFEKLEYAVIFDEN